MSYSDCHCHLGVTAKIQDAEPLSRALASHKDVLLHFFHLMSTNHWDMAILSEMIKSDSDTVVPYFGIHPWYSHLFSVGILDKKEHYLLCLSPSPSDELLEILPEPIPLESHIQHIRELAAECESMGKKYGIGEIGLDRLFRIPSNGYYGNQNQDQDVALTQVKVTMEHQKSVFARHLEVANELRKPVSLHCVKAHGPLFDIVAFGYSDISHVILHSYSGSLDQAKVWKRRFQKQNRKLRFSFSYYINVEKPELLKLLVLYLDPDQILTETDMPLDRFFPENTSEYFSHLENVSSAIIESRHWGYEEGMAQLRANSLELLGL